MAATHTSLPCRRRPISATAYRPSADRRRAARRSRWEWRPGLPPMAKRRGDSRRRHVGPGVQAGVLPALPSDFVQAARTWLGDEADAFLAACARPPHLAVRANALKGGLAALLRALGPAAATWPAWPAVPWWPDALV